ncbi:Nop14-like protein [Pisolithus microcarpus]|nr:Nop14-like protein [Pisolithus microcarpus]
MAKGSQLSQLKASLSQARLNDSSRKNKKKTSHRKLNPFDLKVTKPKHDVGGRKVKGVLGRPTQSRQTGIEQRERTLLKELEERGRVGGIVDRRFGENDPSMSLEERMLERFTRERQRSSKADMFNLEDEELTHYGQSLSRVDDFDDFGIPMDDEDDDDDEGDRVADNQEEPTSKKSKKDVMAEVIAKSKEHKLRRQMEKEQEENIRHQLDQDFDSLKSLLYVSDPSPPEDALDNSAETSVPHEKDDSLDYDKQVRELAFDKRAKPKDRTKTEEELALEKKEALEKAERRRQRRMLATMTWQDGRKRKRAPVGDDLGDDFVEDDSAVVGAGLGEQGLVSNGAEDGEAESETTADTGDDDSEEDEDNYSSSAASPGNLQGLRRKLPYTFPAPASHEEFLEIVEDLVSSLIPHLFALSQSYPSEAAECFIGKLSLMYKNLSRGLASGVLEANSRTWPGFSELTFLRVTGIIWPTSDMKHVVVSPARFLCRVRSFADLASGLFLSSLFIQYEALSKRLVPEAVNFVVNAVLFLAPNPYASSDALPGTFPSPDLHSNPSEISPKVAKNLVFHKPDLWQLLSGNVTEQSKLDALGLAIDLLDRFAELYKPLDVYMIISSLECERLSKDVQFSLASVRDKVGRLLKFARQSRRPLFLQAHKPIPIPTYIPKFEQKSSLYLRRQDPDHERNEVSKLRYQLKQEKKGAIRELRKDARFIAAVEQKKQMEKDQAYNKRMKKVFETNGVPGRK